MSSYLPLFDLSPHSFFTLGWGKATILIPLAGLQMTNLPLPRCGSDDNVGGGLQERRVQEYFSSPELVREGRGSAGLYDHESKGPQGHENLQLVLATR